MNAGIILVAVYWAIFTVKRHFTPRLTAAIKANTYDLNRNDPELLHDRRSGFPA